MIVRLACSAWLMAFPCVGAEAVLHEGRFSAVRSRVVLMPAQEFTEQKVLTSAGRFLEENRSYPVLHWEAFADEVDANSYRSGKFVGHVSYGWWRELYESEIAHPDPMARLVAIQGSAVLQVRDPGGRISRNVLQGEDCLRVRAGRHQFEILYMGISEVPEFLRQEEGDVRVRFYLRTDGPLEEEDGRNVTGILAEKTGVRTVSAWFRKDGWFIDDPFFPAAYRFEPLPPPLDLEGYKRTKAKYVYCGYGDGRIHCQ